MPLPDPFTPDLLALVLAGANAVPAGDLDAAAHPDGLEVPLEAKAFLHLRGRLVIERLLDSLREVGLDRVWILAPEECLRLIPQRYDFTPLPQAPGASLGANLRAAKEAVDLDPGEPALVLFGDHPLTTATALWDFLAFCGPRLDSADYFHGLAQREAYMEYAAYSHRTSVFMREISGRATGLNLIVPDRMHRIPSADHVYSVRKLERIGRFVSLLGRTIYLLGLTAPHAMLDSARCYFAKEFEKLARHPGRLGRFGERGMEWLRRQVRVGRIEKYAAKLFGAERGARVVPLHHGGTAIDVDFAEELEVLEEHWDDLVAIARRQDEASLARRSVPAC